MSSTLVSEPGKMTENQNLCAVIIWTTMGSSIFVPLNGIYEDSRMEIELVNGSLLIRPKNPMALSNWYLVMEPENVITDPVVFNPLQLNSDGVVELHEHDKIIDAGNGSPSLYLSPCKIGIVCFIDPLQNNTEV